MQLLQDKSFQGESAAYSRRKQYIPNWQNGDLFKHTMNCASAKGLGIAGWDILFYKTDEYFDKGGRCNHLMYVTICPAEKILTDAEQLSEIGFLKMMNHDDLWDYWVQISVKNKKEEQEYELEKMGNFAGVKFPLDQIKENPLTAMPMHGKRMKNEPYPQYEEHICRIYRRYGKYL